MLVLPVLMLLLALPIAATSHVGGAYRPAVTFAIIAGAILMVADGLMSLMAMMGMVPILTGVWAVPLLALALAYPAIRQIRSQLFEVDPLDPWTYVIVIALLGGVALLASWIPARRATRVNPIEALRCE